MSEGFEIFLGIWFGVPIAVSCRSGARSAFCSLRVGKARGTVRAPAPAAPRAVAPWASPIPPPRPQASGTTLACPLSLTAPRPRAAAGPVCYFHVVLRRGGGLRHDCRAVWPVLQAVPRRPALPGALRGCASPSPLALDRGHAPLRAHRACQPDAQDFPVLREQGGLAREHHGLPQPGAWPHGRGRHDPAPVPRRRQPPPRLARC